MSTLKFQGMQPLFYSPLTVFQIEDAESLNQQLLQETAALQASSPGLDRSNWRGWHSDCDFFERTESGCQTLRNHMLEAVEACTRNVSPNFDFSQNGVQAEGWINVLGRGGLNTPHDHPAWVWSGCYYVSVPEGDNDRSGNIEFFDPRTNVRALTVDGAGCFSSKQILKPACC